MINQEKGFEVSFDENQRILNVRLWGFWDHETGQTMVKAFKQRAQEASSKATTWYVLADITKFPPQKPEIQQYVIEAMTFAKTHGMQKAARVVANTVTQMQIRRLSQAIGISEHSFFQSEEAAIQWLLRE